MSHLKADSDGSINLDWILAIGFDNRLIFSFVDAAGSAADISNVTSFTLEVWKEGSPTNIFQLTESGSLIRGAGELQAVIGVSNSELLKNKGEYLWQMSVTYPGPTKSRWYNGTIFASSGLHTNTVNNSTATINIGGTTVTATATIIVGTSYATLTGAVADNAALVAALALKQNLLNAATALTDAASIDLTAIKHTLSTAASRTFTISYTGDDITIEVILTAVSATQTFPATALCVSEGVASGDNLLAMAGVSGDKFIIAIKKIGTAYYVVCKNFGQ